MISIKDKIRLQRFRSHHSTKQLDGRTYACTIHNLYPNSKTKDYNWFSFGEMSDEDITKEYYKPIFNSYLNDKHFYFKKILIQLLNDVIYDNNHPSTIEHYELQLYRVWVSIRLIINNKQYTYDSIRNKTIDELEVIYDEMISLAEEEYNKNKSWWKLW